MDEDDPEIINDEYADENDLAIMEGIEPEELHESNQTEIEILHNKIDSLNKELADNEISVFMYNQEMIKIQRQLFIVSTSEIDDKEYVEELIKDANVFLSRFENSSEDKVNYDKINNELKKLFKITESKKISLFISNEVQSNIYKLNEEIPLAKYETKENGEKIKIIDDKYNSTNFYLFERERLILKFAKKYEYDICYSNFISSISLYFQKMRMKYMRVLKDSEIDLNLRLEIKQKIIRILGSLAPITRIMLSEKISIEEIEKDFESEVNLDKYHYYNFTAHELLSSEEIYEINKGLVEIIDSYKGMSAKLFTGEQSYEIKQFMKKLTSIVNKEGKKIFSIDEINNDFLVGDPAVLNKKYSMYKDYYTINALGVYRDTFRGFDSGKKINDISEFFNSKVRKTEKDLDLYNEAEMKEYKRFNLIRKTLENVGTISYGRDILISCLKKLILRPKNIDINDLKFDYKKTLSEQFIEDLYSKNIPVIRYSTAPESIQDYANKVKRLVDEFYINKDVLNYEWKKGIYFKPGDKVFIKYKKENGIFNATPQKAKIISYNGNKCTVMFENGLIRELDTEIVTKEYQDKRSILPQPYAILGIKERQPNESKEEWNEKKNKFLYPVLPNDSEDDYDDNFDQEELTKYWQKINKNPELNPFVTLYTPIPNKLYSKFELIKYSDLFEAINNTKINGYFILKNGTASQQFKDYVINKMSDTEKNKLYSIYSEKYKKDSHNSLESMIFDQIPIIYKITDKGEYVYDFSEYDDTERNIEVYKKWNPSFNPTFQLIPFDKEYKESFIINLPGGDSYRLRFAEPTGHIYRGWLIKIDKYKYPIIEIDFEQYLKILRERYIKKIKYFLQIDHSNHSSTGIINGFVKKINYITEYLNDNFVYNIDYDYTRLDGLNKIKETLNLINLNKDAEILEKLVSEYSGVYYNDNIFKLANYLLHIKLDILKNINEQTIVENSKNFYYETNIKLLELDGLNRLRNKDANAYKIMMEDFKKGNDNPLLIYQKNGGGELNELEIQCCLLNFQHLRIWTDALKRNIKGKLQKIYLSNVSKRIWSSKPAIPFRKRFNNINFLLNNYKIDEKTALKLELAIFSFCKNYNEYHFNFTNIDISKIIMNDDGDFVNTIIKLYNINKDDALQAKLKIMKNEEKNNGNVIYYVEDPITNTITPIQELKQNVINDYINERKLTDNFSRELKNLSYEEIQYLAEQYLYTEPEITNIIDKNIARQGINVFYINDRDMFLVGGKYPSDVRSYRYINNGKMYTHLLNISKMINNNDNELVVYNDTNLFSNAYDFEKRLYKNILIIEASSFVFKVKPDLSVEKDYLNYVAAKLGNRDNTYNYCIGRFIQNTITEELIKKNRTKYSVATKNYNILYIPDLKYEIKREILKDSNNKYPIPVDYDNAGVPIYSEYQKKELAYLIHNGIMSKWLQQNIKITNEGGNIQFHGNLPFKIQSKKEHTKSSNYYVIQVFKDAKYNKPISCIIGINNKNVFKMHKQTNNFVINNERLRLQYFLNKVPEQTEENYYGFLTKEINKRGGYGLLDDREYSIYKELKYDEDVWDWKPETDKKAGAIADAKIWYKEKELMVEQLKIFLKTTTSTSSSFIAFKNKCTQYLQAFRQKLPSQIRKIIEDKPVKIPRLEEIKESVDIWLTKMSKQSDYTTYVMYMLKYKLITINDNLKKYIDNPTMLFNNYIAGKIKIIKSEESYNFSVVPSYLNVYEMLGEIVYNMSCISEVEFNDYGLLQQLDDMNSEEYVNTLTKYPILEIFEILEKKKIQKTLWNILITIIENWSRKNIVLKNPINISMYDLVCYLGDSYQQNYVYEVGIRQELGIDGETMGKIQFANPECLFKEIENHRNTTKPNENGISRLVENKWLISYESPDNYVYYDIRIVENDLHNKEDVSTNLARRAALIYNVDLRKVYPCFGVKDKFTNLYKRKNAITLQDVMIYLERNGRPYTLQEMPERELDYMLQKKIHNVKAITLAKEYQIKTVNFYREELRRYIKDKTITFKNGINMEIMNKLISEININDPVNYVNNISFIPEEPVNIEWTKAKIYIETDFKNKTGFSVNEILKNDVIKYVFELESISINHVD